MRYVISKKKIFIFFVVLMITLVGKTKAQTVAPDPAIEAKVSAMVKQMTLEEKAGQMAQVSIESLGSIKNGNFVFDDAKFKDAVVHYKIGSMLNTPGLNKFFTCLLKSIISFNKYKMQLQKQR